MDGSGNFTRRSGTNIAVSSETGRFLILTTPPPLPLEKVPVDPHRLKAARIVRFRAVYQVADRINLHRPLQRMPDCHLVTVVPCIVVLQPPAKMIGRCDDRHPFMQRRNRRVRRPCDEGKRFNRLTRRRFVHVGVKLAGGQRLDPPVS